MQIEGLIGRQRPGGGGPDDRPAGHIGQRGQSEGARQPLSVGEGKAHVDRQIGLVLVFDFRLGQGRAAVEAPVDRLEATEHETGFEDLAQHPKFIGLIARRHRHVGVVPLAEHTESEKIFFLTLDLFGGIGARFGQNIFRCQATTELLFDLDFDRHAVAVPARDIAGIEAGHVSAFDHHVFQDLVDRVSDMDVAIGIGRPIVQHKEGPAFAESANPLVNPGLLPLRDPFRLSFGEVAAHREGRVGKIERFAIVGRCAACVGRRWRARRLRCFRHGCRARIKGQSAGLLPGACGAAAPWSRKWARAWSASRLICATSASSVS